MNLTVEDIKKCIKEFKPDGFGFRSFEEIGKSVLVDDLRRFYEIDKELINSQLYQLFLQRVIEGINEQCESEEFGFIIESHLDRFLVKKGNTFTNFYFSITTIHIDQAKEQAIKYILEEIK